jgi:hypothetical protein
VEGLVTTTTELDASVATRWLFNVRCSDLNTILHSKMLSDPTPASLTLLHAYDRWHSSRVVAFLLVDTVNHVATLEVVANPSSSSSSECVRGAVSVSVSVQGTVLVFELMGCSPVLI